MRDLFNRWVLVLLALALAIPLLPVGAAEVGIPQMPASISEDLRCGFSYEDGPDAFQGGGCGTFVSLDGVVFGPGGFNGVIPFTPSNQQSGQYSVEDETNPDSATFDAWFVISTVYLGDSHVLLWQRDDLILWGEFYEWTTEVEFSYNPPQSGAVKPVATLYRAAHFTPGGQPIGVGSGHPSTAPNVVGYADTTAQNGPHSMTMAAVNSVSADAGQTWEGPVGAMWDAILNGTPTPEQYEASEHDTSLFVRVTGVDVNGGGAEIGTILRRAAEETPAEPPTEPPPTEEPPTDEPEEEGVERLSASERIGTANAISGSQFADRTAMSVTLARHDNYPDSLAGAALAAATGGPLLLTPQDQLWPSTAAEIQRVLPPNMTVYLAGGTAALSDDVAQAVRDLGYVVNRKAGPTRYDTSVAIAEAAQVTPTGIFLADGNTFQDALVAGSAAAHTGGVVVLTNGSQMPQGVQAYLDRFLLPTYAVGETASMAKPDATQAFVAANVYEVSRLVADFFYDGPSGAAIASGENFPDGLAGGAHAGANGYPLLLSPQAALPQPVIDYLAANAPFTEIVLYGGSAALSDTVAAQVAQYIG